MSQEDFKSLGHSGATEPTEFLESFPCPKNLPWVQMTSDEVTAVCPVTSQPDFYMISIGYAPRERCIESKSLKLKLQSYRSKGIFCEALASEICQHVYDSINPHRVEVVVSQKSRGGVVIEAKAEKLELKG